MEKSTMFKVAELFNGKVLLAFWNTKVDVTKKEGPEWVYFEATRTTPGKAVTRRNKEIAFREKILTPTEAAEYVKSTSEKPVVKKTARAAHGEFTPEMIAYGNKLLENGFDKADIKELVLKKFKPETPKKEEKPCWL